MAELLKSVLRREMKARTEEILKAVRKVEKSQEELTRAIEKWIAFMEEVMEKLEEK
jgi:transcriptional accessory protein Tex/SPT6